MLVERTVHNGTVVISELIGDHLETRRYIGYTIRDAKAAFRAEFPKKARK